MKKTIKLTESQFKKVITETIKKVLNESYQLKEGSKEKNGKYKYMIITYRGEDIVDKKIVYLDKPYLETYDDEVPMTLGSNQALIYISVSI